VSFLAISDMGGDTSSRRQDWHSSSSRKASFY